MAVIHAAAFPPAAVWDTADFAVLLARGNCLTATRTDAGFGIARLAADEAEILTLAVLPAHRRGGTGRALVDQLVEQAKAHGASRLFLEVAEDNGAARALYRSAGFEEIARRPGYYRGDGARRDALVMQKAL